MFDRFEQLLARHDLAQNLSQAQRKIVFVLLCLFGLYVVSALVSTYLAILAGLVLLIVRMVRPKVDHATAAPTASGAVPTVSNRPTPELVAGFDAYMRPARDLLRRVPQDQRAATMIALLDVMEVFTAIGQYEVIDGDDVLRAALAGDLPRLTKHADDLLAPGATLYLNQVSVTEQGRFMDVRLCLVDGTDIKFQWNVRMLGGRCIYRIDQTQTTGR
ncbi:MAG TPA: hypothetical protein VFG42_09810 [Baekduia sp.]|uniref:hypothetical protein n=1 Tax=Baekduia sp. TaxID=2600305 RepID=UPI002D779759|nr:hypothetical protein [Baekduia sp.]HET6507075.1 hypothetical protein [Baekduia sp.]